MVYLLKYKYETRAQQNVPDKWISRGGSVLFFMKLSSLTRLDYYFWGKMKKLAYFQCLLLRKIWEKKIFREIMIQELEEVQANFLRLQACLDQHGEHFEYLLQ